MSATWFVYLVRAADGSMYCGISTDVERRVREHNEGWRGAKCLRGKRPVALAWRSAGLTKGGALRTEREVKALSHANKVEIARNWERTEPLRVPREFFDAAEVNALLNARDRERAPQTLEEIGDYPDPPEDRYDR
jgi:putative endonuclease